MRRNYQLEAARQYGRGEMQMQLLSELVTWYRGLAQAQQFTALYAHPHNRPALHELLARLDQGQPAVPPPPAAQSAFAARFDADVRHLHGLLFLRDFVKQFWDEAQAAAFYRYYSGQPDLPTLAALWDCLHRGEAAVPDAEPEPTEPPARISLGEMAEARGFRRGALKALTAWMERHAPEQAAAFRDYYADQSRPLPTLAEVEDRLERGEPLVPEPEPPMITGFDLVAAARQEGRQEGRQEVQREMMGQMVDWYWGAELAATFTAYYAARDDVPTLAELKALHDRGAAWAAPEPDTQESDPADSP